MNSVNFRSMNSNGGNFPNTTNIIDVNNNYGNNDCISNGYVPSRVIITDLEVQKNPTLELFETEGNILNGKTITINAAGMYGQITGLRNQRDGNTLFGYLKYDSVTNVTPIYLKSILILI